jgi:peptidoglycan hydrolase CwlO-like protein
MGFVVKLVLILAVVAGGVWAWAVFMPKTAPAPVAQQEQVQTPPVEQKPQTPADLISASGSSDASLQADLQSLDAQVESAQSESAGVDQSFNDQPVAQSE